MAHCWKQERWLTDLFIQHMLIGHNSVPRILDTGWETAVNKTGKVPALMNHTFQWEETDDIAGKQVSVMMSGNSKWGKTKKLIFWKDHPDCHAKIRLWRKSKKQEMKLESIIRREMIVLWFQMLILEMERSGWIWNIFRCRVNRLDVRGQGKHELGMWTCVTRWVIVLFIETEY